MTKEKLIRPSSELALAGAAIAVASEEAARRIFEMIACISREKLNGAPELKNALDQGAIDAVREILTDANVAFRVVTCEGGNTNSPHFEDGEFLGSPSSLTNIFDLVVDPLDGTSSAARGRGAAFSLLLVAEAGTVYKPKNFGFEIICGFGLDELMPESERPLEESIEQAIQIVAKRRNKKIDEVVVGMLDRPFLQQLAHNVRAMGSIVHQNNACAEIVVGTAASLERGGTGYHLYGTNALKPIEIDLLVGNVGAPESLILAGIVNACEGSAMYVREQDNKTKQPMGHVLSNRDLVAGRSVTQVASILDNPLLPGVSFANSGIVVPRLEFVAR